jgi:hypothetical protein
MKLEAFKLLESMIFMSSQTYINFIFFNVNYFCD